MMRQCNVARESRYNAETEFNSKYITQEKDLEERRVVRFLVLVGR